MSQETDFEVVAFLVADHAVVSDGKLYVNGGGWDKLQFPSYPQAYPVAVAGLLRVPYQAYHQDHAFVIGLEDSDRESLGLRVEGRFRVGSEPEMRMGDPTLMPFAVGVNVAAIERPGDYAFTLAVDGTELARYNLRAVQVAFAIPPGAGGAMPSPGGLGSGPDPGV